MDSALNFHLLDCDFIYFQSLRGRRFRPTIWQAFLTWHITTSTNEQGILNGSLWMLVSLSYLLIDGRYPPLHSNRLYRDAFWHAAPGVRGRWSPSTELQDARLYVEPLRDH